MLELLATVDPLAAVMAGLWLFAAGLFPVGLMLGSTCSPCCVGPCDQCTEGELPDTLTVAFDGLADQAPGPDLISLSFSSCFGSGAAAQVTAPGGDPATDSGPISAVSLTSGGSGYALLGRVAPTLTVSGGSGTGATFTPTLSTSKDACGLDRWALKSVAVSGGTGYVDGETLTITAASGDTESPAATAIVYTKRTQPTLTLDGNATTTINYTNLGDDYFGIASVSVTSGGSGYEVFQTLGVTLGTNDAGGGEDLVALTVPDEPTLSVDVASAGGSGAVITATLSDTTSGIVSGFKVWEVASLTIGTAGSGYAVSDAISVTVSDGQQMLYSAAFAGTVTSVNGTGGITGVSITEPGEYFKDTGVLASVVVNNGGSFWKDEGVPGSVTVTYGGGYWREDSDEPPYVADVTVTVSDTLPSDGSGADLSVAIDDDTASPTFGEITAVNIDNGGGGYLAHEIFNTCMTRFNGRSIVVQRSAISPCQYVFACEGDCRTESESVVVTYAGPASPMTVGLSVSVSGSSLWSPSTVSATATMTADELSPDCGNIDVTATGGTGVPAEATATITGGGEYSNAQTCNQIFLEELRQLYADVTWRGRTWTAAYPTGTPACGTVGAVNFANIGAENCGASGTVSFGVAAICSGALEEGVQLELFQRLYVCELRWEAAFGGPTVAGAVATYLDRNPTTGPTTQFCRFYYPFVSIDSDSEGYPTGSATMGAGVAHAGNFGGCSDPGTPTISFSRLP